MTLKQVIEVVQSETGLDLTIKSKKRELVDARRITAALIREYVKPLPTYYHIGDAFNQTHSTVINDSKIHKSLLKSNSSYRELYKKLENELLS